METRSDKPGGLALWRHHKGRATGLRDICISVVAARRWPSLAAALGGSHLYAALPPEQSNCSGGHVRVSAGEGRAPRAGEYRCCFGRVAAEERVDSANRSLPPDQPHLSLLPPSLPSRPRRFQSAWSGSTPPVCEEPGQEAGRQPRAVAQSAGLQGAAERRKLARARQPEAAF